MKVAIYSRKSKFTGKGESIGNQIELCKNYCKDNLKNITEFLVYEDEGFSGKDINRPKFKNMLKDAQSKKFKVLICYRLDRVSRNISDFYSFINELNKYNINFISIREQFDTSTPMGRAMMYIASVFAQLERETIAERIKDNMIELAKMGRWLGGQTPLGFKSKRILHSDNKAKKRSIYVLTPISDELEKVNLIYNRYIETSSVNSTLKYLLSNNLTGKNGGEFSAMSINDILRNPAYVMSDDSVFSYLKEKGINTYGIPNKNGILIYNKKKEQSKINDTIKWIAAVSNHKGIIESYRWLYVQRSLDKNSKKTTPRQGTSKKSLLSGILKCGICGSPMRVSYGRPRKDGSGRIYYYTCTMKANSGKARCNNPNVRGDKLEAIILTNLKKLDKKILLMELRTYAKTITPPLPKKELLQKRKQMNALLNNLSKVSNTNSSEFILSKINKLGEEITKLENKLNNLKNSKQCDFNSEILISSLDDFKTTFKLLDTINAKRCMLEAIIEKIEWNGFTKTAYINLWGSKNTAI